MAISFTPQKGVHQEALEQFLHLCDKKTYPAKTSVIRPGDKGDKLYFIIEGSVRICVEDDNGKQELILAYVNKNQFIGELGVFKGAEERKVSINTRSQCQLAEITYEKFHQLLKQELRDYAADLLYLLGIQISERLLITNRKFYDLAFMDVEGRIARTLLDLCKEPDAITHPDGMQLHITRQEIALIVGCSREMAGRVLKELEHKELIAAHGKTIVVFGTR
ncbi:MAG: cAMP-activated global transcriptional regulator CRP [Methylococcaceae bacterium]